MLDVSSARRSPRAQEITRFAAVAALSIDALLIGFSLWAATSDVRHQVSGFLDSWDLIKGAMIVVGLATVGTRTRSVTLAAFTAVLAMVIVLEGITGYAVILWSLQKIGVLTPGPASETAVAYGEVVILTGLASIAFVALWLAPSEGRRVDIVRQNLLVLLATLYFFSVVVGFAIEIWGSPDWWVLEETGERATMSFLAGYVIGLLFIPPTPD